MGRTRDLTCEAQSFRTVFDVIDSMAKRSDGFDWDISARLMDGRPEWVLELWYPERFQARPSAAGSRKRRISQTLAELRAAATRLTPPDPGHPVEHARHRLCEAELLSRL